MAKNTTPIRFEHGLDFGKQKQSELKNILKELLDRKAELGSHQSAIELELCDLYHVIELGTFSASQGYKLCMRQKEVLAYRREVKNELTLIQGLVDSLKINTKMINQLGSVVNNATQPKKYHWRKLGSDDEITSLIKESKKDS